MKPSADFDTAGFLRIALWLGAAMVGVGWLFLRGDARGEVIATGVVMMLVAGLSLYVEATKKR